MNPRSVTLIAVGLGLIVGSFLVMLFIRPPETCMTYTGIATKLPLILATFLFVLGVMLLALGYAMRNDGETKE